MDDAPQLERASADADGLIGAVRWNGCVRGLTHTHYRYPARFSPEFAREAISAFTTPGQLVLDPFMGGGTSAVEALSLGRRFLGTDTNPLAHFVTQVKTDVLLPHDEAALFSWALELSFLANEARDSCTDVFVPKNVPAHIRKAIARMLAAVPALKSGKQQRFARCSILRTAQWALDCKMHIPSTAEFVSRHKELFFEMLAGHQDFSERATLAFGTAAAANAARELKCMDSGRLSGSCDPATPEAPALVLTSPPYLGVHVLYHRWQVRGRKETEAAYWIADRKPAVSGIPFTFAHRRAKSSDKYYEGIRRCFSAAYDVMQAGGYVVQLVAFSRPDEQLKTYLGLMADLRFQQCSLDALTSRDPLAREVPNRKWYALIANQSKSSREFLLVHRKAPAQ